MDINYIAEKDGVSFIIPDTKKSHYENLGYKVEIYVEPATNTKKQKTEEQ